MNFGTSSAHGVHHAAQKLTTTSFPFSAEVLKAWLFRSVRTSWGASGGLSLELVEERTIPCLGERRRAAAKMPAAVATKARTKAALRIAVALLAFGDRIAFLRPVGAEAGGQIEHAHFIETALLQLLICRADVRTVIEGAAAAVDHHESIMREGFGAGAQLLHAFRSADRPDIFGPGNVGLRVKHLRPNIQ